MRRGFLAGLAVILIGSMMMLSAAQMPQQQDDEEGPAGSRVAVPTQVTSAKASRTAVKPVKVDVPVTKAARTDAPAFRGEGWFQQKCGLCHLGRWRKAGQLQPSAPPLTGVLKGATAEREAAVRQYIQRGSVNMPGFQNAFTPAEFEELIAYLKTL
jgi:mono/diheme cytochrome c family protein